jgi:hypothetical protein
MKAPSKPNGLREVRATPEAILSSRGGKRPRTCTWTDGAHVLPESDPDPLAAAIAGRPSALARDPKTSRPVQRGLDTARPEVQRRPVQRPPCLAGRARHQLPKIMYQGAAWYWPAQSQTRA